MPLKLTRFWRYVQAARWLLEWLTEPQRAAEDVLEAQPVKAWLSEQTPEVQQKVRQAVPLVLEVLLEAIK